MHIKLSILILFLLIILTPFQGWGKPFVVVIDPGHGGDDSGAVGAISKEKVLNLQVALKVGNLINKGHQDVVVIYTRKTDRKLDLNARADIANKAKADLFISIHANAKNAKSKGRAYGIETYTLGLARSDENLEVAKRENSVIKLEENYEQKYENFDPSSTESYIIFEFIQNKFMEQSASLASYIQKEIISSTQRSDRGVKQAGFLVLRATSMPSVLVEMGFITDSSDEKYMNSDAGQKAISESIYQGFKIYKKEYDRKSGILSEEKKNINKQAETADVISETSDKSSPEVPVSKQSEKKNSIQGSKSNQSASQPQASTKSGLIYKVQVLISSQKLPAKSTKFKGYTITDFYLDKGVYKYTYGESTDESEIQKVLSRVSKDFKDAFVVTFRDGVRIK